MSRFSSLGKIAFPIALGLRSSTNNGDPHMARSDAQVQLPEADADGHLMGRLLSSPRTSAAAEPLALSHSEIEVAMETIGARMPKSHPHLLALDVCRDILQNPDLVEATLARIKAAEKAGLSSSGSSSICLRPTPSPPSPSPPLKAGKRVKVAPQCIAMAATTSTLWETLKTNSHVCGICLDVIASPTITSCGHSFCGSCINSLIFHSQNDDDEMSFRERRERDRSVVSIPGGLSMRKSCGLLCPTCRAPMTSSIFERGWDHLMDSLVSSLPETEGELKAEWRKRRSAYHDQMLSFHCLQPKANLVGEEGGGEDDGEAGDGTEWSHFYENPEHYILPVVFAVLALIMFCRNRH